MGALIDITGQTFGRLTVIKRGENDVHCKPQWWCRCNCGNSNLLLISGNSLRSGKTKSCGCSKKNRIKKEKHQFTTISAIQAQDRIGQEKYNNSGDLMKIIKYNNSQDVTVEFQDEYKYKCEHTCYSNFIKGTLKNPYNHFLYNRGYLGVGKYHPTINSKPTKAYDAWRKMFTRAYDNKLHKREPEYYNCEVDKRWWNFQHFAEWFESNYRVIPNASIQVDKDWIVLNNKIYAPETCELVPAIINNCLLSHAKKDLNNNGLPVGIQITSSGRYKARVSQYGKRIDCGTYDTLEDAMCAYLAEKVQYIKQLADTYRPYISNRLYKAMYQYKNRFILENPAYEKIQ